jgi:hypothetical protein
MRDLQRVARLSTRPSAFERLDSPREQRAQGFELSGRESVRDAPLHCLVGHDYQGRDGSVVAAAAAPASEQVSDFQKVQAAGVQQAWYVGVAVFNVGIAVSSSVTTPPDHGIYLGNELDTRPISK